MTYEDVRMWRVSVRGCVCAYWTKAVLPFRDVKRNV